MENVNTTSQVTPNSSAQWEGVAGRMQKAGKEFGEFYPYDAQIGAPEIEGARVVKCLYKASSDGKKTNENSYCYVPTMHLTDEIVCERIAELAPYVVSYLQGIEDTDIKDQHKKNASKIYTEYLTLDKILETLEASEAGARLNAEKIGNWFVTELQESLTLQFATKLGIADGAEPTEEQAAKLVAILDAYNKKFQSLASGKTFLKEADCKAMTIAIHMADASETLLGKRFIARLENMKNKEEDLLLSL